MSRVEVLIEVLTPRKPQESAAYIRMINESHPAKNENKGKLFILSHFFYSLSLSLSLSLPLPSSSTVLFLHHPFSPSFTFSLSLSFTFNL
jgi:hypothetical protein